MIEIETEPRASLRSGIILYVVQYDSAAAGWLTKAEIALETLDGSVATGRILGGGDAVEAGDAVAFYEGAVEPGLDLAINPAGGELLVGQTMSFTAELTNEALGPLQNVTANWRSSDPSVLNVTQSGQVAGMSPGVATLTANTSSGLVAAVRVRVFEGGISAPSEVVAFVGTPDTLHLLLLGQHLRREVGRSMAWRSEDPSVVDVDSTGVIQPHQPGAAEVIASGYGERIVIPVRVYPQPVNVSVTPPEGPVAIVRGDTLEATAAVMLPDGAWLEDVRLNAVPEDTFYLLAATRGRIQAIREGSTRLTARIGSHRAVWEVSVEPPNLSIEQPQGSVLLGSAIPLKANYARRDGSTVSEARGAHWQSLTPDIISGLRADGDGGRTRKGAAICHGRPDPGYGDCLRYWGVDRVGTNTPGPPDRHNLDAEMAESTCSIMVDSPGADLPSRPMAVPWPLSRTGSVAHPRFMAGRDGSEAADTSGTRTHGYSTPFLPGALTPLELWRRQGPVPEQSVWQLQCLRSLGRGRRSGHRTLDAQRNTRTIARRFRRGRRVRIRAVPKREEKRPPPRSIRYG